MAKHFSDLTLDQVHLRPFLTTHLNHPNILNPGTHLSSLALLVTAVIHIPSLQYESSHILQHSLVVFDQYTPTQLLLACYINTYI